MSKREPGGTAIAVFDLDGTITRYDTYVRFLLLCIARKPAKLLHLPGLAVDVVRHKAGRQTNSWLKQRFLSQILAGFHRKALEDRSIEFAENVMRNGIYQDATASIQDHKNRGIEPVLLSASLDIYVEPLGRMLGFQHIICTRTCWQDDRLLDKLDGENCYGDIKIKRVQQWLAGYPGTSIMAAYADHESDFPLLKLAERGIVVNPDKKLKVKARSNNLDHVVWR